LPQGKSQESPRQPAPPRQSAHHRHQQVRPTRADSAPGNAARCCRQPCIFRPPATGSLRARGWFGCVN